MNEHIARDIAKKGISGMQSSSPASNSLYLDSDILRNPFQAILPTLAPILIQRPIDNIKTNKWTVIFKT